MNNERIYLSSPHLGGNEIKYVTEAIDTNWVAPLGPNVNGMEQDICAFNGIKHCAALSSGSAALHLALIILGVDQHDEVLCSSFTFSASANVIAYQKATPIFIDSELDTWNMCPVTLEAAIKDRLSTGKKPKACILVHLYGMPAKLNEIMAVCNKYEIPLIEDAAESLGSTYDGKHTGTFGKIGIYSFNGNKIITTSGGGALVSNQEKYVTEARFLATQSRDDAPHYQHSKIGYNYRMSNIVAGVGRGQMEVLDERVNQRRAMNMWYRDLLSSYDYIQFQDEPTTKYYSNYWLTAIVLDPKSAHKERETIRLHLEESNIEARPLWKPLHLQPIFAGAPFYNNNCCLELFKNGLCLPSGSNTTEDQKIRIEKSLREIL